MDIELDKAEEILIQQSYDLTERLARIEERQTGFTETLQGVSERIHQEIQGSVTDRMNDLARLIAAQQQTQSEIVRIQSRQGEQIDSIRTTLDKFTELEHTVSDHEGRILSLEKHYQGEIDLKKERIKGVWATIGAIIAALASIATVLITAL